MNTQWKFTSLGILHILIKFFRKKTINDLREKLKKHLIPEPNITSKQYVIRFWKTLITEKEYNQTLEEYFMNKNDYEELVYVEVVLPNGIWPSDNSSRENIEKSLTNGLVNLGNSISIITISIACYMNVALQTLMNTKYIKEYILSPEKWKNEVNLSNPLGKKGELILAFANLVKQNF